MKKSINTTNSDLLDFQHPNVYPRINELIKMLETIVVNLDDYIPLEISAAKHDLELLRSIGIVKKKLW